MNLKYIRLLMIASIINIGLGLFLIICGIFEFTGMLYTNANNTIESVGVQLSYLVFISGILTLISGFTTVLFRRNMAYINLLILIAVVALAWPIFVSISLFFSQMIICIRLLPTMMSSLFYIIAILIVKISNEALNRTHTFNPSMFVESLGLKKGGVNVSRVMYSNVGKKKTGGNIQGFMNFLAPEKRRTSGFSLRWIFHIGKRRGGGGFWKILYGGKRRHGGPFRRR